MTNDGQATRTRAPGYIEDLDWLINDAPAALGERGVNQDPSKGGGGTLADNWGFIERSHQAMPDVRRERRLRPIFDRLTPRERNVASAYYTRRQALVVTGATAAFGQFARVALLLAGDERQRLAEALSNATNSRHVPVITAARKAAHRAVDEVHESWERARRAEADRWAEGA